MLEQTAVFPEAHKTAAAFSLLMIFLIALGIENAFIQDDAFISFRYAQNLVAGHGLTWNAGESSPIEGYSNFLWVMMIAATTAIGIEPILGSMILSGLLAIGTLFFTYRLAQILLQSSFFSLLSIALLGTNYSFSSYITGGLETQLQTFLVVVSTYAAFHLVREKRFSGALYASGLSLLLALALMTRLDSALIGGALYLFIVFALAKEDMALKKKGLFLVYLTLPALTIVGAWLLFKLVYYGEILPNTYYVKAASASKDLLLRGVAYIWSFFYNYYLIPLLFLGAIYGKKILSESYLLMLCVMVCLWCLYIAKVGGDFMEYRFIIPVLPFIFILISKTIQLTKIIPLQFALVTLVLAGSYAHAVTFKGDADSGIESISQLNAHIVEDSEDWRGAGLALGDLFLKSPEPVTLAVTPAGAIPFYSQLDTIDMLGLNDRWVAREGPKFDHRRPGHTRYATLSYLIEREANLIIGHPEVTPLAAAINPDPGRYFWMPIDTSLLPEDARIIAIPINKHYKIEALYLTHNAYIDEQISKRNFTTSHIDR